MKKILKTQVISILLAIILMPTSLLAEESESNQISSQKVKEEKKIGQIKKGSQSIDILYEDLRIANENKDLRGVAEINLEIATNYLEQKEYEKAIAANHQGLWAAETIQDSERLFKLFQQNGKIYLEKGAEKKAVSAYGQALWNLRYDRRQVPMDNNYLLFALKEEANLFLKEYINLLLSESESEKNLSKILEVISVLKLSEFQIYFNDPCLDIFVETIKQEQESKRIAEKEAIIYTFITPEKTYLLSQIGKNTPLVEEINVSQKELTEAIEQYRLDLVNIFDRHSFKKSGNELYKLIIAPLAGELKRNKISEIIFINDGILRNVPMEALTTNEGKYLLEEYAIAYQIGLKSLDFKIPRQAPTSLLAGTSEFLLPFQPLAEIAKEIKIVSNLVNNPAILLNKEFTESNFKISLQNNNHSIIHLATHGIFEGSAENSFLLTYDEKIPLDELTDLLLLSQEPIGLLVLTACETAEGSELAPLGIAGTGVRAGAANILATLWEINDLQTVLFVEEFYSQLNQGESIAKAKQAAQLSQKEQHPGYWASFIHFQFETDQN